MKIVLRPLSIFLAAFSLIVPGAQSAEAVVTQAVGTTCDDALRQAKGLAAERVAGSYLNSQRTLRNDNSLEESVNEYAGGVVTSFKVLESNGQQPCTVTIQANVDLDKSKIYLPPVSNKSLDLGHVGALVEKRKDGSAMVGKLVNRPDQFTVDISDVSYKPGAGITQLDFEIRKITYSSQWQADLEALLSIQGKPVIYELPGVKSIAKGLLALLALPVLIPAAIIAAPFAEPQPKNGPQNPEASICFPIDNKLDRISCYEGTLATDLINQLSNMSYSVVLKDPSDNLYRLSAEQRFTLIRDYWSPAQLIPDDATGPRQQFIVISSTDFPRKEQLYVEDRYLKQGMGLAFVVGKPTQE